MENLRYEDVVPGTYMRIKDTGEIIEIVNVNTLYGWVEYFGGKKRKLTYARIEDIEPIVMTAEMLESNGFLKSDPKPYIPTEWDSHESDDGRVVFLRCTNRYGDNGWNCHIDSEDFSTIGSLDFMYVNELQVFLRLNNIEKYIEL